MAKWGGQADANAESAGGGGNFKPALRGIYTIQVADFKDGMTKGDPENGKPARQKVDLECEIADEGENFGKKVWLTITKIDKDEKGHGLMIHSLHAFGLAVDGDYEFDTSDLQGRQARVLLGIETREKVKDGRTYVNEVNFVEQLYTEKHPEPADGQLPPPRERKKAAPAQTASAASKSEKVNNAFPNARATTRPKAEVPF